jgi:hypothetical protein
MKISISKIRVSTKALYITAGIVVLLAVIILALALSERQSRVEAAQSAAKTQATNTQLDGLQADNGTLRASNKTISGNLAAVCTYVTSLSLNKTLKPAVVVPPACK